MSGHRSDVLDRAHDAGLVVGNVVNVLFSAPDAEPMLRRLTSVAVKLEYGKDWLVWRWSPEGTTPHGTTDCGFGGNVIDADFLGVLAGGVAGAPP